jgi:flagellar basal-body rod protein FlgG
MNGAFYVGAAGLDAQQRALDVISNNIANINTTGFKRSAVRFSDLVVPVERLSELDAIQTQGVQGLGVAAHSASHVWTQGELRQTGQSLDVAIDGEGFIEMMGPAGETLLWRGGTLKVDTDGYLAASDGTMLHAMISVPRDASTISISRDGIVTATVEGDTSPSEIGRIDLVMVKDKDSLGDAGGGYYRTSDASGIYSVEAGEEASGVLIQGSLETANVQLSEEMVSLLLMQRAYAANAQVVQAGDQLMGILNNLRR